MEWQEEHLSDRPSRVLKWVLLGVGIGTFIILIWATLQTYKFAPPRPNTFLSPSGEVLMTADDIVAGKGGFQRADLMDYGSIYGMGSYFGIDYTAEYLVELGRRTEENLAEERYGVSFSSLREGERAEITAQMKRDLQSIDMTKDTVHVPTGLAEALASMRGEVATSLRTDDFAKGYTAARSLDEELALQTADFLLYSSLTTVARRPGTESSWTQNWPYEPSVGNTPTSSTFLWTWVSFCFTFFAFGLVIFIYERYLNVRDDAPREHILTDFRPLTPSQRKTGKYFIVVAAVFLLQLAAGTLMAHYYAERTGFYGVDIASFLPFNFLRAIHVQAPIVWIGLAWIGGALFIGPAISKREPRGQGVLVDILFWATVTVVVGALVGNYLGIMNVIGDKGWFWFGNQGLSYIELGRAWQIGFFGGLLLWSILVMRALWPTWERFKKATWQFWTGAIQLENLLWFATLNIALLYVFGMIPLTGIEDSFSITDFWRWWVVHLWVEQSFEFFAVAISAYLLMETGLVSRILAQRAVYFELILIFLGGVIGTGHHFYWVGGPGLWVPMGSMFSFIEVLPLVLLITESISQYRLIRQHHKFEYKLAYTFIIGAAFWNFVGAGVFGGGTINAPLVNYYEHGTFLTLNHAHTALFGAFGLLAIGFVYYCLRYAAANRFEFSHRLGLWAFWLYNAGLVLWIFLNFFPIGWPQLVAVYEHGYAYARSLAFYDTTLLWQWLRVPGDVLFGAGALLMAWDILRKLKPLYTKGNID
ncbi:MAG TPA: cbb3-type cytochrome c oxidase subunit I [Candidatus Paceibacterota bacterium]|nr:cbb3-type cytochrome c oxidase subunit I [Candidatus Paceibacterota bacterium]